MKYCFLITLLLQAICINAQVQVSTITTEFNGSGGVKIGPDQNVYIADFGASLQNANGTQVWVYVPASGVRGQFASGLSGASGNDFDSQGNLFQSNIGNSTISKISPQGGVSLFTSIGIAGPVGIAIDQADNLYVCNCSDNTIRKISPQAVSTPFASHPEFACPNGITMDTQGFIYMSNFNDGKVFKIDSLGNASVFTTVPGANNGHLTYSHADSMIYLASHGSSRIYRIELDGSLTILAGNGTRGNQDGPAQFASFSRPNGIAVSKTGDTLYVNSSIPLSNTGFPLNPSILRMISGVNPATVGIEDEWEEKIEINIYPNPVRTRLKMEVSARETGLLSYSFYQLDGKQIQKGEVLVSAGKQQLSIALQEDFPSALYLLTLSFSDQSLNRMVQIMR